MLSLKQINNMESNIHTNVYILGEMMTLEEDFINVSSEPKSHECKKQNEGIRIDVSWFWCIYRNFQIKVWYLALSI